MSMNGEPDRMGVRTGPSVMDMMTGVMTASAVLAALYAREQLGRGQLVEAALFDTAVNMLGFHAMNYLVSGYEPTRFGNNSRQTHHAMPSKRRIHRSSSIVPMTARGIAWQCRCWKDRTWPSTPTMRRCRSGYATATH